MEKIISRMYVQRYRGMKQLRDSFGIKQLRDSFYGLFTLRVVIVKTCSRQNYLISVMALTFFHRRYRKNNVLLITIRFVNVDIMHSDLFFFSFCYFNREDLQKVSISCINLHIFGCPENHLL